MMGAHRRRWLAPEVVQTSVMDCGPAALKCLLEGFRIPVSYGRLREACQTDVDGTSIDALEDVAGRLGLEAQQVLLPIDHVVLREHSVLPALMTVRLPDGSTHFIVAWRRHGSWLQIMDPAAGRRWVRIERLLPDLLRHEASVPLGEWRDFAASPDFLGPLRERFHRLGIGDDTSTHLVRRALADPLWFTFGALDACLRFVAKVTAAHALRSGKEAEALVGVLLEQTLASDGDIFRWVPEEYWSVVPDPESASLGEARLLVRGAVLITVSGTCPAQAPEELSPELAAALTEAAPGMVRLVWSHLRDEGRLAPLVLAGAVCAGMLATLVESLLFRGLFDISIDLALGGQRLAASLALISFLAAALLFRLPIATEGLRLGRHLEARLRVALFTKLPQLADRYFHSRPVSDMAERAHAIQAVRSLPGMGAHLLQTLGELVATIVGVAVIDPRSTLFALAIAGVSIGVPALAQRLISERDLRLRNQSGALARFHLDALMGIAPIRAHHAETSIARQFESLLTEWTRTSLGHARAVLATEGLQAAGCTLLAGLLLLDHFQRSAGVTGSDLLLVYWTLRLPALADQAGELARQYPAQRNILLRLVEPLTAPVPAEAGPSRRLPRPMLERPSVFGAVGWWLLAPSSCRKSILIFAQASTSPSSVSRVRASQAS